MARNEVYFIEMQGSDMQGRPIVGTKLYPAYTCGHCTSVILLRDDRSRERKTCFHCGRWICEKNEICNKDCTPIYEMAKDHFENVGQHGKWIPAIMNGMTTEEDALKSGFILP